MTIKTSLISLIGVCAIMVACACVGCASSEKSISIDGYTFTADLDDNWVTELSEVVTYDPRDMEDIYGIPAGAYDWTGTADFSPFYYRSGEPSGSITKGGWANILVLTPKKDYLEDYERSPSDILKHATDLFINPRNHFNAVATGDLTEKEIEYNGREARLVEVEDEYKVLNGGDGFIDEDSEGVIAFSDNDTIVVIYAFTTNDYGMRAWDVIDSITVV